MGITQCITRAAQNRPRAHATTFGSRTRRWHEFAGRVARLAGALRSLGIGAGDRVAALALNSDRYLEYYAAVPWAGAVVVPLNTRWSAQENIFALRDSGAKVLMIDDALAPAAHALLAEARSLPVIHLGDSAAPGGMTSYEHLIESSAAIADAAPPAEELAGIFYTSGTTGRAKGVMLSHRSLWASAAAAAIVVPRAADSVTLHAAPMFSVGPFSQVMAAFLAEGRHVIIPRFEPERVFEAIERDRVTHVALVPTMVHMLVSHPNLARTDLASLRCVTYAAAPMPEALLRTAMQAFRGCDFVQLYGQTELSPTATVLPPDYHALEGPKAGKLTSAGRATPCCTVDVVDDRGLSVPCGTVGEIRVRGLNTMLGYWNNPEATAAALREGWIHTGDAGRLDEEGFVYVVDRVKDMIIRGGENIYSAEVENACASHPAVAQCAVIGIADEKWGEAVHAIVILKEGRELSAADLIDHCRGLIAGYKCPRTIEFRTDPFPLSAIGKVLKRELRRVHRQTHENTRRDGQWT